MPIKVRELGHIVLYVKNLKRSVSFYRDILGFNQIAPQKGSNLNGFAAFSQGRTHHELLLIEVGDAYNPNNEKHRLGLYHFGLKIGDSDEDLKEALRAIEENGVGIVGMSDHTVTHSVYIKDPDGNEIELFIDVPDVNWSDNPGLIMSPIKPLRLA